MCADKPKGSRQTCEARCHCGRRCYKDRGHYWKHRCLRHGNY